MDDSAATRHSYCGGLETPPTGRKPHKSSAEAGSARRCTSHPPWRREDLIWISDPRHSRKGWGLVQRWFGVRVWRGGPEKPLSVNKQRNNIFRGSVDARTNKILLPGPSLTSKHLHLQVLTVLLVPALPQVQRSPMTRYLPLQSPSPRLRQTGGSYYWDDFSETSVAEGAPDYTTTTTTTIKQQQQHKCWLTLVSSPSYNLLLRRWGLELLIPSAQVCRK